eukprot:3441639-Pyramimonas_sp.AAC.1
MSSVGALLLSKHLAEPTSSLAIRVLDAYKCAPRARQASLPTPARTFASSICSISWRLCAKLK